MVTFCLLVVCAIGRSQLIERDTTPSFEWRLSVIDFPYMKDAAQAEANNRMGKTAASSASIAVEDYGNLYRNLSMTQTTEMARNLHGSLYYLHNKIWEKWKKPTTKKAYILNRLFANVTALGTDVLAIKLPYGFAFQHEEFHRSVMATRGIYSYDEVWNFGKGLDIAVTQVKDEDLIYLKKNFPADQVRLSAAGVEGEYAYFQTMREDNFFKKTGYPFLGLSILGTFHAINYVNLPFKKRFNDITDSILSHDKNNILARDFTGYDFSAWVYDLQTPSEPYEARGTWPGGTGVRRPIKETDLTPKMKSFLRETGNMQYLNLVSPFMIGINRLKISENFKFNFALRSLPTSFGYYAGGDFFLEMNKSKVLLGLGANRSNSLTLPSLEIKIYDLKKEEQSKISADAKLSAWLQPKDQLFFATKAEPGFMLNVQPNYRASRHFRLFADLSYKTKGWVFANPYLDDNFTGRIGFKINTVR